MEDLAAVDGPLEWRQARKRFFPGAARRGQFWLERRPPSFRFGDLAVQFGQLCLVLGRRRLHYGLFVSEVVDQAALRNIVKESEHSVKIALREGIVLVVMAAGAAQGHAEPNGCGSLGSIGNVLDAKLFLNDSPLAAGAMVPLEAGSDLLLERSVRQQVSGDLLDGELVERHIAAERVDDPVAP